MAFPGKVTAPISRSTAYDFNCELAHCHRRSRDVRAASSSNTLGDASNDECVSVMPHELLFRINDGTTASNRRMTAMSSMNGVTLPEKVRKELNAYVQDAAEKDDYDVLTCKSWPENMTAEKNKQANKYLNQCIQYVGVAVTGCAGGAQGALQRQGFSATRGGLVTVLHTGKDAIPAGAKVALEVHAQDLCTDTQRRCSTSTHNGIPKQKIVAHLVEVKDDRDIALGLAQGQGNVVPAVPVDMPYLMSFGAPLGRLQ